MADLYNPKGLAINTPMGTADLYPSKTLFPGHDGSLTSSNVMFPTIDQNPLGYEDLNTLQAKYSFDLGAVTATFHREMFPFQWLADFNAKAATHGDVHVQAEDFDQDTQFHDSMLNKLRLVSQGSNGVPLAITDANNFGGRLLWRKLTTGSADIDAIIAAGYAGSAGPTAIGAATLVNKTASTGVALDAQLIKVNATGTMAHNRMILPLAWSLAASGEESQSAGGTDATTFIAKIAALFEGNNYKQIGQGLNVIKTSDSAKRIYGYIHENGTKATQPVCTLHSMFNDLAIKVDDSQRQLHEVNVRIYGAVWTDDYKELVLLLDFDAATLEDVALSATAANNIVLLEECHQSSTAFDGGFTRLSQHILIGMFTTVPEAIAQGTDRGSEEDFVSGYMYDVESKENFCQIVQSPKLKISGTYLASQNKLKLNQPQKMREDMMMKFKQFRTNLALYGKGAARKRDAQGNIKNYSAGFLCYQQNPIRYMRMNLNRNAGQSRMEAIKDFVMNYARSVFAYKTPSPSNVATVMISKYMQIMLDDYVKMGMQEQMNAYGTSVGSQPMINGNTIDMDVRYTRIVTPYGTLEFAVEPAFTYMTEMMLPSFVTTTKVDPRYIMMAVDKSKISTISLRAPVLRGNIQSNSADFTMEDMLCEETLEVLNPMSHSITLVNVR